MKAPDKIYCGNNGHGNLSYSREKVYPSMEEYIRKDALLDFLKELRDEAGNRDEYFEEGAIEEYYFYQNIIDRINSL